MWVGPAPRELTLRGHSLWELQTLGWSLGDAGSPEEVCMGSEDVGLELAPEGVGKKECSRMRPCGRQGLCRLVSSR